MAFVFVKLRGEEHQIEYWNKARGRYEWIEWEFAEPTKLIPDLTIEESKLIEAAIRDAENEPD